MHDVIFSIENLIKVLGDYDHHTSGEVPWIHMGNDFVEANLRVQEINLVPEIHQSLLVMTNTTSNFIDLWWYIFGYEKYFHLLFVLIPLLRIVSQRSNGQNSQSQNHTRAWR